MKKTVAKAKSILIPIPPAPPSDAPLAGGRVFSKTLPHLGREKVWDTYQTVMLGTQLRQHSAADIPQLTLRGCHALHKMSEYSPKG